jgi:low affinity Fe/Cu permease
MIRPPREIAAGGSFSKVWTQRKYPARLHGRAGLCLLRTETLYGTVDERPRMRPKMAEITNSMIATKKMILAISTANPAMPPNPKTAAISATIKKVKAQPSMALLLVSQFRVINVRQKGNVPSSVAGNSLGYPRIDPAEVAAPRWRAVRQGRQMARKLVHKRYRHSIAAKPATRISSGGRNSKSSSSPQSGTRTSNGSPDKQGGWHAMFSNMACNAAHYAGHPLAFLTAVLLVLIWALTGPLFDYSDTWQLVINTSTTIVTFLMVFLIQHTQNRDTLAVQLKLAELIMAATGAENRLATAEDLSEEELEELHKDYQRRAEDTLDRLKQHRAGLKHAN